MRILFVLTLLLSTYGSIAQTNDSIVLSYDHCSYCECAFCGHFPAEFPGGMNAFRKYIAESLRNPIGVHFTGTGKCYLSFTVDTNGSLTNIEVARGVPDCPECDAEAVRVLQNCPKWKPANRRFTPYPTTIHLPIVFVIH
jgi:TonB family protein